MDLQHQIISQRNRTSLQRHSRLPLLDTVRGLTMISMIAYHGCWDIVYLLGYKWSWYTDTPGFLWQQSICWTFILLSGFCIPFSRRLVRRGLQVFCAGVLVTVVTLLVLPEDRVIFGVLTLIGSCMLIMALWRYVREKLTGRAVPQEKDGNPAVCAVICFLLFLLSKNINSGYLGIGALAIYLPEALYANYFTTYLGFMMKGFFSTDYFSILPWLFLYLTGYHLHWLCRKMHAFDSEIFRRESRPLSFLGRHSLLIYLLHQPVLYAIVLIITMLWE